MRFKNFRIYGATQLLTDLVIQFDASRLVRPKKPITIGNILIDTNSADPANARGVTNCLPPRGPMPKLRRYAFYASSGTITNDSLNGSYSTISIN